MQKKVCCFGEILLRFAPNNEWATDNAMQVFIGGAELNAATALANWNIGVKYVTAVPDNYLSLQVLEEVKVRKINVDAVVLSGNRIGSYYLPIGSELKHAGVIYDRAFSSFSELKPGTINWKKILEDCSWFHFSAISPALTADAAAVCREAVEAASAMGLTISVDLNYRSKLWQYGKQPVDIMPELVKYCHVVMGNIWAVESLLGIESPIKESTGKTTNELIDAAGNSMLQLHQQYPLVTSMAYTFRLEKEYWAVLQHGATKAISKEFIIETVVDKVGSGDCFMAGLIYGFNKQHDVKDIIDFAAAAAVEKLQEAGDCTKQTIETINKKILQWTKNN